MNKETRERLKNMLIQLRNPELSISEKRDKVGQLAAFIEGVILSSQDDVQKDN